MYKLLKIDLNIHSDNEIYKSIKLIGLKRDSFKPVSLCMKIKAEFSLYMFYTLNSVVKQVNIIM